MVAFGQFAGLPVAAQVRENKPEMIENWDMSRMRAYLKRTTTLDDAQIETLEREYKRYLLMRLANPTMSIPMGAPVDPMWHAHLLFSADYRKMCEQVFGFFLDHKPIENQEEQYALRCAYTHNTLVIYEGMFGKPDPVLWPPKAEVCGDDYC